MLHITSKSPRRPVGFGISAMFHVASFLALTLGPSSGPSERRTPPADQEYTVLVLNMDDVRPRRPEHSADIASSRGVSTMKSALPAPLNSARQADSAQSSKLAERADSGSHAVLPPLPRRDRAPQTLIQPVVPPDLRLASEIPLPTVMLWQHPLVPMATKKVTPVVQVPDTSDLSNPDNHNNTADLKVDALLKTHTILPTRPFVAPAARGPVAHRSNDPQQLPVMEAGPANVAALISLPDSPVVSARTVAIPAANQVAASGSGGLGKSGAQDDRGSGAAMSPSKTPAGQGSGSNDGNLSTLAVSNGGATTAAASSGTSLVAHGEPGGGGQLADLPIAGTTRVTLPKDGTFSVVVAGPSLAAPYTESEGALSGKIVYSVFLGVGLPKKWILEYCLPKSEEQKNQVKGHAQPINAPFPYVIVRPNDIGISSREYVIVRGILSVAGRFEQLALVFPNDLGRKDLLMESLRQWTFRPASRDGVPAEVEVLLIIPSQPS